MCQSRRKIMGNIFQNSFQEIWNGDRYQEMRQESIDPDLHAMCRGCGYRFKFPYPSKVPYDIRNFLFPQTLTPDYSYPIRWSGRTAQLLDLTQHPKEGDSNSE